MLFGNLVQDDLRFECLRRPLFKIGPKLFFALIFTGVGKVLLEREPSLCELLSNLLPARFELGVEQVLGYLDFKLSDQGLQYGVAGMAGLFQSGDPSEAVLDVRAELFDGVEFRCFLGELIVGVRQLGGLHLGDRDLNIGFFVLQGTADQLRDEGRRLAGRQPDDGVVQAIQHLA